MSSLSNSPLHTLFLTEAVLKVIGGSTFFLSPSTTLKNLSAPPFTPISLSLVQTFGSQTIAFSIPLFLAAKADGRTRKLVYWTLLAREGFLMLGLLGQIGWAYIREEKGEEMEVRDMKSLEEGIVREKLAGYEERKEQERVLRRGLWMWVGEVVPFVVGRLWVLRYREGWF